MKRKSELLSVAIIFSVTAWTGAARAQYYAQVPVPEVADTPPSPHIFGTQIAAYVIAGLIGFLIGALFSDRLKQFRRYIGYAIGALIVIGSFVAPFPVNGVLSIPISFVIFLVAVVAGLTWGRIASADSRSTTFGSAKWATAAYLHERGMIGEQGLALGYFPAMPRSLALHYTGDRHLLTVAPTRAGKGVAAIIPNLLTYRGSALVIDPKGENAMITAKRRGAGLAEAGLGQKVHIVDPWGLTKDATGMTPACFNPIDWIDPASPDASENAMMLADSLVVPPPGGSKDPFWDEESKALLMGLILYVATAPEEDGQRHLGRVRDLLMLSVPAFDALMARMLNSGSAIVASTAARTLSKEPKLLSGVLSAAQSHTHMLDSPKLRDSLSRSDFTFADLKQEPTTVYLVLPADRLNTFGRWLRLIVQQAITVTARDIAAKPKLPILFILDEMAALGKLTMVEQAYGLMAGFGMQLWGIVQDLSQLHRIYGDGWQTFIGNSGVIQYFGSRDQMTAEYFSSLCGTATVPTLSSTIARTFSSNKDGNSESNSTSHAYGEASRKLMMADELMTIGKDAQLVLIENLDPIAARKITWYEDNRFKALGRNIRQPSLSYTHPASANIPAQIGA